MQDNSKKIVKMLFSAFKLVHYNYMYINGSNLYVVNRGNLFGIFTTVVKILLL